MGVKKYNNVGHVLFGFTLKKNIKQAIIIGIMSSIVIVSTAVGFANAYPTEASRVLIAATFNSNTGIIALLGKPDSLVTIGGFTAWRSLGVLTLIVSIWAIFLSSRLFRGDEEQGRLELVLTGKSTLANATKQLFSAVVVMLLPVLLIITVSTSVINSTQDFGWQLSSILFLALSVVLTALVFVSIGALSSQIAATRSAALKITAAIFGVSFMLRALGDISSEYGWLSALSPLGWLERLHPLSNTNTIWLVPIIALITACIGAAVYIAGRRDYGESLLPDKDSAKPKFRLLGSGGGLLVRLHKANALVWVAGLFVVNFMFGTFLGTVTEALDESGGLQNALNQVTGTQAMNPTELFMGVIFIQMILLMAIMVAGQTNNFRDEEARGYMDNLLVRQSTRLGLSAAKVGLIVLTIIGTAFAAAFGMYLGAQTQDIAIDGWAMAMAGLNLMTVPLLFLGAGFLFFGFVPRLMSVLMYSLIGWTFVIEIIGSAINLNHWILDTSILHHVALVPAQDLRWDTFWVIIILAVCMAVLGVWRFTKRDIELM